MGKGLKLYVWEGVLVDYTAGVMFALAHDVAEAREMVCPGYAEKQAVRAAARALEIPVPGLSTIERDLAGKPDVYDAPCGFAVWGGG